MSAATYPAHRGERIVLADLLPGSLVRDTVLVLGERR
jgi:hypothetical protein